MYQKGITKKHKKVPKRNCQKEPAKKSKKVPTIMHQQVPTRMHQKVATRQCKNRPSSKRQQVPTRKRQKCQPKSTYWTLIQDFGTDCLALLFKLSLEKYITRWTGNQLLQLFYFPIKSKVFIFKKFRRINENIFIWWTLSPTTPLPSKSTWLYLN